MLPSVTSPTKLPDRPTLPAAWPLKYFEDPQPDPRVFWGPATRRRFKNIEWWLITESAQKRKQKRNEKKQYLEKPRRFKLIPGNEKKKIRLFWQNTNFITKYYTHTPTDWLLEVVQGVPTTKRSRKSRTPCKFGHKYTTSHPPLNEKRKKSPKNHTSFIHHHVFLHHAGCELFIASKISSLDY